MLAVLPKPRTRSRTFVYTYDTLQLNVVLKLTGDRRRLTCRLSERRSERISVTREKRGETRESVSAIAPVAGTMLDGWTKTGRPPSVASVNRVSGLKLMSTGLA